MPIPPCCSTTRPRLRICIASLRKPSTTRSNTAAHPALTCASPHLRIKSNLSCATMAKACPPRGGPTVWACKPCAIARKCWADNSWWKTRRTAGRACGASRRTTGAKPPLPRLPNPQLDFDMATKSKSPSGPAKKNILVVDDHPMTRLGQVETLNREADLTVCGQAGTARETMDAISRLKPDVLLMDLTLPDKEGLELIKDVQALHAALPVLVCSMHDEAFYAARVLRAGARGYIMKSEGPEKLVAALRTVLSGQIALSPQMSARLLEAYSGAKTGGTPEDKLTDRELEVLRLFGEAWSSEEAAEKLQLSPKTVDVHRVKIKENLSLPTTPEFLRFASRWVQSQR